MAVTENMVYNIEIKDNTEESRKNISNLSDDISELDQNVYALDSDFKKMNLSLNKSIITQIHQVNNIVLNFRSLRNSIDDTSNSLENFSSNGNIRSIKNLSDTLSSIDSNGVIEVSNSLQNISANLDKFDKSGNLKVLEPKKSSIETYREISLSIESLINNINRLFYFLEKVSDPNNLKAIAKIFYIFATYQGAKGNLGLAANIKNAADYMDILSTKTQKFNLVLESINDDTLKLSETISNLTMDHFIKQFEILALKIGLLIGSTIYLTTLFKNLYKEILLMRVISLAEINFNDERITAAIERIKKLEETNIVTVTKYIKDKVIEVLRLFSRTSMEAAFSYLTKNLKLMVKESASTLLEIGRMVSLYGARYINNFLDTLGKVNKGISIFISKLEFNLISSLSIIFNKLSSISSNPAYLLSLVKAIKSFGNMITLAVSDLAYSLDMNLISISKNIINKLNKIFNSSLKSITSSISSIVKTYSLLITSSIQKLLNYFSMAGNIIRDKFVKVGTFINIGSVLKDNLKDAIKASRYYLSEIEFLFIQTFKTILISIFTAIHTIPIIFNTSFHRVIGLVSVFISRIKGNWNSAIKYFSKFVQLAGFALSDLFNNVIFKMLQPLKALKSLKYVISDFTNSLSYLGYGLKQIAGMIPYLIYLRVALVHFVFKFTEGIFKSTRMWNAFYTTILITSKNIVDIFKNLGKMVFVFSRTLIFGPNLEKGLITINATYQSFFQRLIESINIFQQKISDAFLNLQRMFKSIPVEKFLINLSYIVTKTVKNLGIEREFTSIVVGLKDLFKSTLVTSELFLNVIEQSFRAFVRMLANHIKTLRFFMTKELSYLSSFYSTNFKNILSILQGNIKLFLLGMARILASPMFLVAFAVGNMNSLIDIALYSVYLSISKTWDLIAISALKMSNSIIKIFANTFIAVGKVSKNSAIEIVKNTTIIVSSLISKFIATIRAIRTEIAIFQAISISWLEVETKNIKLFEELVIRFLVFRQITFHKMTTEFNMMYAYAKDTTKRTVEAMGDTNVFKKSKDNFTRYFDDIYQIFLNAYQKIKPIFMNIGSLFVGAFNKLKNFKMPSLSFPGIKDFIVAIPSLIASAFNKISFKSLNLGGIFDALKPEMDSFVKFILSSVIPGIKTFSTLLKFAFNESNLELFKLIKNPSWNAIVNLFTKALPRSVDIFSKSIVNMVNKTGMIQKTFELIRNNGIKNVLDFSEAAGAGGAIIGFTIKKIGDMFDSTFLKITGDILTLVGVLFGGLRAGFVFASSYIGSLALSIGTKLSNAIEYMEEKFRKADLTMRTFQQVLINFGKTVSSDVIGNFEDWSIVINDLSKKSIFSIEELQTSIKLLLAEGQNFGFNFEDNVQILYRLADVASATGKPIVDLSNDFISSLVGNAIALNNLGINLTETAIAHSKYLNETKKSITEMTKQEMLQIRLAEFFKQSIAYEGMAALKTDTLYGSTMQLNKAYDILLQNLGRQGIISKIILQTKTVFVDLINSIPTPLLNLISILTDLTSTILTVSGVALTFVSTIMGVVTAWEILNLTMLKFPKIVAPVVLAINMLIVQLGGTAVVINSASTLLKGLATLLLGSVRYSIIMAIGLLKTFTIAIINSTIALLASPLFWKGAAIIAIVIGLANAISEVTYEYKQNSLAIESNNKKVSMISEVIQTLTRNVNLLLRWFVELLKFIVTKFVQGFLLVGEVVQSFSFVVASAFTSNKAYADDFSKSMQKIKTEADVFQKIADSAYSNISSWDNLNKSIDGTKKNFKKANGEAADLQAKLAQLGYIEKSIDRVNLRIKVFGDEFEQSAASVKLARSELEKVKAAFIKGEGGEPKEKLEEYKRALEALIQVEAEREKLRKDTGKTIRQELNQLLIEELKNSGKILEASNLERNIKLQEFDERFKNYKKLNALTKDEIAQLENLRKAIESQSFGLMTQTEQLKTIQDLRKESINIENEINAIYMDSIQALEIQNGLKISDLELKKQEAILYPLITQEIDKQIKLQRELNKLNVIEEKSKSLSELGQSTYKFFQKAFIGFQSLPEKIEIGISETKLEKQASNPEDIGNSIAVGFAQGWNSMVDFISSPFKGSIVELSETALKISEAFDVGYAVFSSAASMIASLFDPTFIQGLADSLIELIEKLPEALQSAFLALDKAIQKTIDKLPQIASKILEFIPKMLESIFSKLPSLIDVIGNAIVSLFEKLPSITEKIFAAVPLIVERLMANMPKILESFFNMLPIVFSQALQMLPDLVLKVLDKLPAIIEQLIISLTELAPKLMLAVVDFVIQGGVWKIIVALVKNIPRIIGAIIVGTLKGIASAMTLGMFGGLLGGFDKLKAMGEDLEKLPDKIGDKINNFSKNVARETSQVFKVLDMEESAKKAGKVKKDEKLPDLIDEAMKKAAKAFFKMWQDVLEMFNKAWNWLNNVVLKPFISSLTEAWRTIYNKIILPFLNALTTAFNALTTAWRWVYDNVIMPLINGITTAWLWVYDNVVMPLINGIMSAFSWVSENIIAPIMSSLTTILTSLVEAFNNLLTGIKDTLTWASEVVFKPFISSLQSAFIWINDNIIKPFVSSLLMAITSLDQAYTKLSKFFASLGEQVDKAFSSVYQIFNGLTNIVSQAFQKVADIFNPSSITVMFDKALAPIKKLTDWKFPSFSWPKIEAPEWLDRLTNIGGGGGGGGAWYDPTTWFASEGGIVSGVSKINQNSRLNDTVLSLLSPGEAVIPINKMKDPAIRGIVQAILEGNLDRILGIAINPEKARDILSKKASKFYNGGNVGGLSYNLNSSIGSNLKSKDVTASNNYSMNVTLNIETKDSELDATYIRTKLIPSIKDEFKKASLRGEFLIANRGVRTL